MYARVTTFAIDGIDARRVEVEADIRSGLPAFTVVGLADTAVREARERVRAAIVNSGFEFPLKRITVNLAPADLRKIGPGFDLPLALAVLAAAGQLEMEYLEGRAVVGELALTGEVRSVKGALAYAEATVAQGLRSLVVPGSRASEAALVPGARVIGVGHLSEAVEVLRGVQEAAEVERVTGVQAERPGDGPDLADVRGHAALVPALEVVAAGGHNLFMHGPPGTGKTMLARRLATILAPMSEAEAIEVTKIHSVAGLHTDGALVSERPFRAPHHTISAAGLVGGGVPPGPGETTLAHHGVLFLDELTEFSRPSLEALRQPLEDGRVTIVRAQQAAVFPTRCTLVAASNPCSCSLGAHACRCSAADVARHARRLSAPLLDRIDVSVSVERPSSDALATQACPPSAQVRERVIAAREIQFRRYSGTSLTCNAHLPPRALAELGAVTARAESLLARLHDRHGMSARGHGRVLRVARTFADLDQSRAVEPEHVLAAAALRLDGTALQEVA